MHDAGVKICFDDGRVYSRCGDERREGECKEGYRFVVELIADCPVISDLIQ